MTADKAMKFSLPALGWRQEVIDERLHHLVRILGARAWIGRPECLTVWQHLPHELRENHVVRWGFELLGQFRRKSDRYAPMFEFAWWRGCFGLAVRPDVI